MFTVDVYNESKKYLESVRDNIINSISNTNTYKEGE